MSSTTPGQLDPEIAHVQSDKEIRVMSEVFNSKGAREDRVAVKTSAALEDDLEDVVETVDKLSMTSDVTIGEIDVAGPAVTAEPMVNTTSAAKTAKNKRKKELAKKKKAAAKLKPSEEIQSTKEETDMKLKADADQDTPGGSVGNIKEFIVVPPGLPFEIKTSPGKGLGVFATKNIKKGTEILREEAIIKGCRNFLSKEALFMVLSDDRKKRFLALSSQCNCEGSKASSCTETALMKIWEPNSYMPLSFKHNDAWTGSSYVYELASRINHDCLPNAARSFTKEDYIVFRALRDIKKGEEISSNYLQVSGTTYARRKRLLQKYKFTCGCRACTNQKTLTWADVSNSAFIWDKSEADPGQVINKLTKEEFALNAEVDAWSRETISALELIEEAYRITLARKSYISKNTPEFRKKLLPIVVAKIAECLKQNNKFGFEQSLLDSYCDLFERSYAMLGEAYPAHSYKFIAPSPEGNEE